LHNYYDASQQIKLFHSEIQLAADKFSRVWRKKKNQRKKNAKIHILSGSKKTIGETTAKLVASIKLSSAMT
jgi:uncharacterized protein YifE (UPF0438 family)